MKNCIIVVLLAVLTAGCKKSFLDVQPTDRFTQENFWKTKEQAEAALNGVYAALVNDNLYGGGTPVYFESISPNAYNYSGTFNYIAEGIHDAANTPIINNTWGACYGGIGRANNFLANVSKVPVDDAIKKRYIAEAKFLRALFYLPLWNLYGGAPLITEATNYETQSNLPRNSASEILDQILKDLNEAGSGTDLPLSYSGVDKGRVTRGAVYALQARILLYAGRWTEAADAAKKVIDQKTYTLFPDYRGLFYLENEQNQEVIFDVQFKYPEITHSLDINLDQQNSVAPLPDLINDYEALDGLPITQSPLYNAAKPYENRDPRLQATIMMEGTTYKGAVVTAGQYPRTGYGQKKYTIFKDNEKPVSAPTSGTSELNYILLRYADVLLTYAEAKNEAAGPGADVYDVLNQVRARVQMPAVKDGISKDGLRQIIRHERRVELAGEGLYYYDVRRWKIAATALNTDIFNNKDQKIDFRRYAANRDELWPVPSVAIQQNTALTQNPGYGK